MNFRFIIPIKGPVNTRSENMAKKLTRMYPDATLEIYDNGKLIDTCLASDCFNVYPVEHES